MPRNKDLKRRVRERMTRTGERYTAARARVAYKKASLYSAAELEELAGMSNGAVEAATGRDWRGWLAELDGAGATSMPHRDIARLLHHDHGVSAWWSQSVTVGYERIRGLRDKGQRRGGGYDVNKSKTFAVPVSELYRAFGAPARRKWMGAPDVRVKTASREKSMRLSWQDGSPVDVYFWSKGVEKSQVQIQHRGLATRKEAESVRAQWTERLSALGALLRGGRSSARRAATSRGRGAS